MKKILIDKKNRRLMLLDDEIILREYSIGIGKNTTGAKVRKDDFRTPEGLYRVIVKNPKSKFFLSLGLNYPNSNDAWRGFKQGLITAETCQQILEAHCRQQRIPWNTPLGGEIYIHGGLEDQAWSQGCIRLYNRDMRHLYDHTTLGTAVEIV